LRVTAPSLFGRLHMVPIISNFLNAHPRVSGRIGLALRQSSKMHPNVKPLRYRYRDRDHDHQRGHIHVVPRIAHTGIWTQIASRRSSTLSRHHILCRSNSALFCSAPEESAAPRRKTKSNAQFGMEAAHSDRLVQHKPNNRTRKALATRLRAYFAQVCKHQRTRVPAPILCAHSILRIDKQESSSIER
jgi:DNA-binding transcriptional LysR family regulator